MDSNTCQQCGVTNKTVRQSGKGFLVCQPCYDKIHPEESHPPAWDKIYDEVETKSTFFVAKKKG